MSADRFGEYGTFTVRADFRFGFYASSFGLYGDLADIAQTLRTAETMQMPIQRAEVE